MTDPNATRLAVLIDADNTTPCVTEQLLEEVAKYGTPTVKRADGDWTTTSLTGWKAELPRHAIQPMQQFANTRGRNATDSALIMDEAFGSACDRFIHIELITGSRLEAPVPAPNLEQVRSTTIGSPSKGDGWSNLAEVGSYLIKSHAAFDPRTYGHSKLSELVRGEDYVEVRDVPLASGMSHVRVRLKPPARKGGR